VVKAHKGLFLKRIAIVGLDGLDWHTLIPLIKEWKLRGFAKLLSRGILGVMKCYPPLTPPSWTSILTGVKPEKHGIWGVRKIVVEQDESIRWRLVNAFDLTYPRLNEILSSEGMFGIHVNYIDILAYPPEAQYLGNQIFVYRDPATNRRRIYPTKYESYSKYFEASDIEGILRLNEEFVPDVLIAIFNYPDVVHHYYPNTVLNPFNRKLLEILSKFDKLIDSIYTRYDIIVIVSDHGFSFFNKGINLLSILRQLTNGSTDFYPEFLFKLLFSKLTELVLYSLLTMNLHPARIKLLFKTKERVFSEDLTKEVLRPYTISNSIFVDLSHSASSWSIYVVGRKLVERVYKALRKLEFFEEVHKYGLHDDIYLVHVVPKDDFYVICEKCFEKFPEPLLRIPTARHSPYGVFIMHDKSYENVQLVNDVYNVDVVPTVLARLGLPIPSYTDGKVMIQSSNRLARKDYRSRIMLLRKIQRLKLGLKRSYDH